MWAEHFLVCIRKPFRDMLLFSFFVNEDTGPERLGDLPTVIRPDCGTAKARPRASHSEPYTVSPTSQSFHHLAGAARLTT